MFSEGKGKLTEEVLSEQNSYSPRSPSLLPVKPALDFFALTSQRRSTKSLIEEEKELRKQLMSQRTEGREETPYVKIMKRCSALQRDLSTHWTEAANNITARRTEWGEAKRVLETASSKGPWKGNAYYCKMRTVLETRITKKTDPAKELDKEVVLRLASTAASPSSGSFRGYVSLSDMTPRRLEFLSRARRGFGKRPLSMQQLIENLSDHSPEKKWEIGSEHSPVDRKPIGSERIATEPAVTITPRGTPVNDFILKQRNRFLRNKVSRLNIERRQAVEAAMQRISVSPDILHKAKRLEAKEMRRKVKFLRKKAFELVEKTPETPIELRELKAEIVNYRKNIKEEITMDRRVRKSILLIRD